MRWPLLALLALCGMAFAPSRSALPRGDDNFQLGWTTTRVDSALGARGVPVLSRGYDFLTAAGERPEIEFVQYAFAPKPHGPSLLWKVTVAYRVPYTLEQFESVRGGLTGLLGAPDEERLADPEAGNLMSKITWVDSRSAVQLGARWPEIQDPRADRMIVTWTDRRLQKQVEVQRRANGKK